MNNATGTSQALQNNERLRAASRFNNAADDAGTFSLDLLFQKFQVLSAICSAQQVDLAPWSVVLDQVVAHRSRGGRGFDVMAVAGGPR